MESTSTTSGASVKLPNLFLVYEIAALNCWLFSDSHGFRLTNLYKEESRPSLPGTVRQLIVGVALLGNSLNRKIFRTPPTKYTRPTDALVWKEEESQGFGQRRELAQTSNPLLLSL